jgi:hypothetical protein
MRDARPKNQQSGYFMDLSAHMRIDIRASNHIIASVLHQPTIEAPKEQSVPVSGFKRVLSLRDLVLFGLAFVGPTAPYSMFRLRAWPDDQGPINQRRLSCAHFCRVQFSLATYGFQFSC